MAQIYLSINRKLLYSLPFKMAWPFIIVARKRERERYSISVLDDSTFLYTQNIVKQGTYFLCVILNYQWKPQQVYSFYRSKVCHIDIELIVHASSDVVGDFVVYFAKVKENCVMLSHTTAIFCCLLPGEKDITKITNKVRPWYTKSLKSLIHIDYSIFIITMRNEIFTYIQCCGAQHIIVLWK